LHQTTLPYDKFIFGVNKNTTDSTSIVENAGLTVDREELLKGINRNTLIQRFNEW